MLSHDLQKFIKIDSGTTPGYRGGFRLFLGVPGMLVKPFRHHSYMSKVATGIIAGFGVRGYLLALNAMSEMVRED